MTRMLAIEWIGHNIRVNAVAPATVLTASRAKMYDEQTRERMLARIPTGRFITPEEVAAAVVFLASPGAASITGQTLRGRRRVYGELKGPSRRLDQGSVASGTIAAIASGCEKCGPRAPAAGYFDQFLALAAPSGRRRL